MKKIYTILLILCSTYTAFAQYGELSGRITDEKKVGLFGATVKLVVNNSIVTGAVTDVNGDYLIKLIPVGKYDIQILPPSGSGRQKQTITDYQIFGDKTYKVDAVLLVITKEIKGIVVTAQSAAKINFDNLQQGGHRTAEDIKKSALKDVTSQVALATGVAQRDIGAGININGGRSYNTKYYVDGIPLSGTLNLPQEVIQDVNVITGGLEAKYGDATSGVVSVTTKPTGNQLHGGLQYQTSQGLDAYGYNQGIFSLTGPLFSKRDTIKDANGQWKRKKVVGFFLVGEFDGNGDQNPNYVGTYRAKSSVMNRIEQNPLMPDANGAGLVYRANTLTMDSLDHVKTWQNNSSKDYRMSLKLDYALPKNSYLVLGGSVDYQDQFSTGMGAQLLAAAGNSERRNGTYRGFARFQQYFQGSGKEHSVLQNASYQIQIDYTKVYNRTFDPNFNNDIFKYGYIGKFDTKRQPLYQYGTDSTTGLSGWRLITYQATHVTADYTNTANPLLANYTKQYYNYYGYNPAYTANISTIEAGKGLVNGDAPGTVYSLFSNVGVRSGSYNINNNDQYHLSFNASVDLKNPNAVQVKNVGGNQRERGRHSIEFGFEYEQHTDRYYALAPQALWGLMRQLTDQHLNTMDFAHPHLSAGGDTIRYSRLIKRQDQSTFDKNLRKAIHASDSDYINIDAVDPNILQLSMFSPDELFNNGAYRVIYSGYDYLGNPITGKQPSFNDFFTATNSSGVNTRPIPAYRPIYTAGYIEDKFKFNDLLLDVGVRVDRFDANQSVLKDPYVLYPTYTAQEVTTLGTIPSTIPGDAVVYVDDAFKPTKITGFREGDVWYNAQGTTVDNPKVIANPNTGTVTPYLKVSDRSNLQVTENSFTTYKPQTNVMPRISFSFPISDKSNFFAHYDVLTQRPNGTDGGIVSGRVNVTTPFEYTYLQQLTTDFRIANPNLKPERTIEYQAGFQQQLTPNSNITLSALYRELRDQIQVTRIRFAYPVDYNTYGNTDFGTVKELLANYVYAPEKIISLNLSYTLSFADGTGSSVSSFLGAFSANPDVVTPKPILPFSYDQRHTISASVDFRFKDRDQTGRDVYDGPKALRWLLAATGVNINFNGATGTPYTAVQSPNSLFDSRTRLIKGTINGSRLPFNYRFNLQVDHTFSFQVNARKRMSFRAYLIVLNMLNTKNILSVYSYTGSPSDDGYLNSPAGQTFTSQQVSPAAFNTLYQIYANSPGNYSQPRQVRLGLDFSF